MRILGTRNRRYALVAVAALAAPGIVALTASQLQAGTPSARTFAPASRAPGHSATAGRLGGGHPGTSSGPIVITEVARGSSVPVKNIPPVGNTPTPFRPSEREPGPVATTSANQPDGAVQSSAFTQKAPGVLQTFDAIKNPINGFIPPDVSGDVGPNDYVLATNAGFAVYSKTGAVKKATTALITLWQGLSTGLCRSHDDGDPVVVYDRLADRWVISQFAVQDPDVNHAQGDYHECFAVSKTSDPTGAYFAYDFLLSTTKFDDYPKVGVWPDGYYVTFNDFDSVTGDYVGVTAASFNRTKMLNGQAATGIKFELDATHNPLLPSHFDGRLAPPSGAPNQFAESIDPSTLHLYPFHVDFATPGNSTFGVGGGHAPGTTLTTATFNSNLCDFFPCIPQRDSIEKLDAISDRLMQQLRYRNMGGSPAQERLVVNQTVNVGSNRAGVRWYQLQRGGGAWSIGQQSTFSPDSTHRWMGSAALDGSGDLALGFSGSSASANPSIRYTGRTPADPANTLEAETVLLPGMGAATNIFDRWGDYTTMSVDPTDDCTFWYANEYYKVTADRQWTVRIGSFRFPTCVGVSSFSPASGSTGTPVTVNGVGFTSASKVKFNGVAATTTFVSSTKLTAVVPTGATTGRISVTTGANSGLSAGTFTVVAGAPPTISSFAPPSGITGSVVTITGSNLSNATAVTFAGIPSPLLAPVDSSHLKATVPNGALTGTIKVTNPFGSATSASSFTPTLSIQSFTPPGGFAGAAVTINGVGFAGTSSVKIANQAAAITSVSANQLKVTAPGESVFATGTITVTTPAGTVSSAKPFYKRPTIEKIAPTSGSVGQTVVITGKSFTGATSVKFNGKAATYTVDSKTQITATVPAGATTGKVTVANPGGAADGPVFTVS